MNEAKEGLGVDRHLFGLKHLAYHKQQRVPNYRIPAIFTDKSYSTLGNTYTPPSPSLPLALTSFTSFSCSLSRFSFSLSYFPFRSLSWSFFFSSLSHSFPVLLGSSVLSTSNCGSDALRSFGFGPVVSDGLGLGYMIHSKAIPVTVSSFQKEAGAYATQLENSLREMKAACLAKQ